MHWKLPLGGALGERGKGGKAEDRKERQSSQTTKEDDRMRRVSLEQEHEAPRVVGRVVHSQTRNGTKKCRDTSETQRKNKYSQEKSQETEKNFLSAGGGLAREVGKCVSQVAQGNPD